MQYVIFYSFWWTRKLHFVLPEKERKFFTMNFVGHISESHVVGKKTHTRFHPKLRLRLYLNPPPP